MWIHWIKWKLAQYLLRATNMRFQCQQWKWPEGFLQQSANPSAWGNGLNRETFHDRNVKYKTRATLRLLRQTRKVEWSPDIQDKNCERWGHTWPSQAICFWRALNSVQIWKADRGFDFTNVSKATSETVLAEPTDGSSFERTIPHWTLSSQSHLI